MTDEECRAMRRVIEEARIVVGDAQRNTLTSYLVCEEAILGLRDTLRMLDAVRYHVHNDR